LKPWRKEQWVLPAEADADFACAMEDVLEVYTRPLDMTQPVVCVDEASKQLIADITPPLPMEPGQSAREDYEYERRGTANVFMAVEPLAGRRHVKITGRRTKADFAEFLRDLSDVHYANAAKITIVMDNLNTHKLSVLYGAYPPAEARRLYERFEVHYTPKHASWLNVAECELSVLGRQCLARRIDSHEELTREVATWNRERNAKQTTVDWRFTTPDARIKLKRLYPILAPTD
jgi:DDE superfamily endonuclease